MTEHAPKSLDLTKPLEKLSIGDLFVLKSEVEQKTQELKKNLETSNLKGEEKLDLEQKLKDLEAKIKIIEGLINTTLDIATYNQEEESKLYEMGILFSPENIDKFENNLKSIKNATNLPEYQKNQILKYLLYLYNEGKLDGKIVEKIGLAVVLELPTMLREQAEIGNKLIKIKAISSVIENISLIINKIQESLFSILEPRDKILDKIKEITGDDEKMFFEYFYKNKRLISFITDKKMLQDLIDHFVVKGEKVEFKYLSPELQNSDFLANEGVELGGIEYLNLIDEKRINEMSSEEKMKIFDALLKKEKNNELNIEMIILKLVEIDFGRELLGKLIMDNDIIFPSIDIAGYLSGKENFNSNTPTVLIARRFLNGINEKNREFKGVLTKYGLNHLKPTDKSIESFMKESTSEEKELVGEFLFKNTKIDGYETFILQLIDAGFSSKYFDEIINQDEKFLFKRIEKDGLDVVEKISPKHLEDEKVIQAILYSEGSIEEKITKLGTIQITNINRILQIFEYAFPKGNNYSEEKVYNLVKNSKFLLSGFNLALARGDAINERHKETFDKIKIILSENEKLILSMDVFIDVQVSAKEKGIIGIKEKNIQTFKSIIQERIMSIKGLEQSEIEDIDKNISEILKDTREVTDFTITKICKEIAEKFGEDKNKLDLVTNKIKEIFKEYARVRTEELNNSIDVNIFKSNEYIEKVKDGKSKFSSKKFLEAFYKQLENKEKLTQEELIVEYEKFIELKTGKTFNELDETQQDHFLEILQLKDIEIITNLDNEVIYEMVKSGYEGPVRDYLISKGLNPFDYMDKEEEKENDAKQNITEGNDSKNETFSISNYDSKTGKFEIDKNTTITLSSAEQNIVNANPETLEKIVSFYQVLDKVSLTKLWNYRMQIFTTISNIEGQAFKVDSDYLNEKEIKIFLNSILKSVGETEISSSENLESFLNQFERLNNTQVSGTEKKEGIRGESQIERKFRERYVRNNIFKLELFENAFNSEQ